MRSMPATTLSVAHAARRLGVHPNTVRTWTRQGRLRCLRINERGDRRYRVEDLDAFLRDAPGQMEMLRRVGAEISGQLDLDEILRRLVDHARVLFAADRGGVFRRSPDGRLAAAVSQGLSPEFLEAVQQLPAPSLGARAMTDGRAAFATDYVNSRHLDDGLRETVRREGFNTVALAPLAADGHVFGLLGLYHDQRHDWTEQERVMLDALAAQASVAVRNADNYARMANWAAQLQSIQKLGGRLSHLASAEEIGSAIALELQQLIDYHNVRVYRVQGDACVPVAWRGIMGEYNEEDERQLRVPLGFGITGWVAVNKVAQILPDAAADPRSQTIPGTADDLPESMLLAPMLYEDRALGVIVLSKLGTHQFTSDDRRLLEIYASFAAQAFVTADTTHQLRLQSEALARQVQSQRELLRVTESILTTLDPRDVLEEIAARLSSLVPVDTVGIDLHDPAAHLLRPILARGKHAEAYLSGTSPDDEGVAGWVLAHGVGRLVGDEAVDRRGPRDGADPDSSGGSLIVVPLRARARITGVMTLQRDASGPAFSREEFELIELFAAQVSVAMHNAQTHRAVELRAETDALTGLKNQGAFHEHLAQATRRGAEFSLLVADLDDFKGFNDHHGHPAGDELLQLIGTALEAVGRDSDTVFRYGGDEFALILPATDLAGAAAVAEKAVAAVRGAAARARHGMPRRSVQASIGIAVFPTDGTDPRSVLLAADAACYLAKRSGTGRIASASDGLLPEPAAPSRRRASELSGLPSSCHSGY